MFHNGNVKLYKTAEKKQQQENKWKEKHAAGIGKHEENREHGSSMGHGDQGGGRDSGGTGGKGRR